MLVGHTWAKFLMFNQSPTTREIRWFGISEDSPILKLRCWGCDITWCQYYLQRSIGIYGLRLVIQFVTFLPPSLRVTICHELAELPGTFSDRKLRIHKSPVIHKKKPVFIRMKSKLVFIYFEQDFHNTLFFGGIWTPKKLSQKDQTSGFWKLIPGHQSKDVEVSAAYIQTSLQLTNKRRWKSTALAVNDREDLFPKTNDR